MDEDVFPRREHTHLKGVGDEIWQRALKDHAPPALRKFIEENGELPDTNSDDRIRGWGGSINHIRDHIQLSLISQAAEHLRSVQKGRVTAVDIANLLTTDKFNLSPQVVGKLVRDKFPFLAEKYDLLVRSLSENDGAYAEVIRKLWQRRGKKPDLLDIADELGLTKEAARLKLVGKDKGPKWLVELYDHGPDNKKP